MDHYSVVYLGSLRGCDRVLLWKEVSMSSIERLIRTALIEAELARSQAALNNRIDNCRKWREIAGKGPV